MKVSMLNKTTFFFEVSGYFNLFPFEIRYFKAKFRKKNLVEQRFESSKILSFFVFFERR